ncbi:MAG: amino acid adenylation domain-containing protein [Cyanobacteria bacterium J06555_3]
MSQVSGHDVADLEPDLFLESDLGLDSIKTVQMLNGLVELIPPERQGDFLQAVPMEQLMQLQTLGDIIAVAQNWLESAENEPEALVEAKATSFVPEAPAKSQMMTAENNVSKQIYTLVSQVSGHDVADLEADLFLESDLGLDSIKTVQMLNGLVELIPPERQGDFLQAVPMEQLMQLQTLGDIIAVAQNWLAGDTKEMDTAQPPAIDYQIVDDPVTTEAVDLTDSQYIMLAGHFAVSTNTICSTVRFEGTLDPEIARQSGQQLLLRHPLLRAYFAIPPEATSFKDYQLLVMDNPPAPELSIIDLSSDDAATQERQIQAAVDREINQAWCLEKWSLHRFFAFRLAENLYELAISLHHVIADGLSAHIVLREFLEIYGANLNNTQPNLPPATTLENYHQQIAQINNWRSPEAEKLLQKYLSQQGNSKFFWNPQKGAISEMAKTRTVRSIVDQSILTKLTERARDWRLPLNCLFVGSYLRAVASFQTETESIIINIPTSGRTYPNTDVSNVVGCFAENLALSFPSPQADSLSWLKSVQSQIQTALADHHDNAQTRQIGRGTREQIKLVNGQMSSMTAELIRTAIKSNLYFSNMGQTGLNQQYGTLEVLNYRSSTATNAGCIDTLAEIFDDRLYFNTNYDRNVFTASFIDRLLAKFLEELENLAILDVKSAPAAKSFNVPIDFNTRSIVQQVVSSVCHLSLGEADFDRDLETDMGIDSLESIRIITELERILARKLDRQALLSCRSLDEIARVLSPSEESAAVDDEEPLIPYVAIAQQVRRTPNAIAVLDPATPLTYLELHRLSNQVAHCLREQGVKPGNLVGIMTQRNSSLWVGILGILKAGAAYVPIDLAYPTERICYMLNHAEIDILLTESPLVEKLESLSGATLSTLLFLDEGAQLANSQTLKQLDHRSWSQQSAADLPVLNTPDDLMTVLYTSGSTGRPKGVMLAHRGYMNRLEWMQKTFPLAEGDRVAQKTSCCFDISIWEIFWPLMVGATVCPVERDIVRNPWNLAQWLNQTQINVMHFVPSLFGEFINALAEEEHKFPHLRWLIFSGEALPIPFIQDWWDRYGTNTELANLYGPTEASIDVSCHIIRQRPGEQGETSIPIGKAIDNVDLLLLDKHQNPVTPGELGELWIGGVQLAQGYLKDPERTAKTFCANKLPHIAGKSLYRTGDLAKQLPDGSFEYHGRIDNQVKIRGFRIELGEVENVLLLHPAVSEAAVVVMDFGSGQKRLVASLAGKSLDARQMKQFLRLHLPDYMIPHRLEWFASLPKNHNGKLDRKALLDLVSPENAPAPVETTEEYLPLGPAQRWLLRYFDAPYQWAGYSRCLYHQPLDLEIFNQAINCLVERHWALRTIFVQRQGQWWQQEIQPEPLQAIYYDGSHLSAEARNQQIHQRIEQIGREFRIDRYPLIQALVIKVDDACYDINIVGHHIISDMLGSQLLLQEFWFIYRELLGDRQDFLADLPPTTSYADFVRYLMAEEQQGLDRHLDYWKSEFPSPQSAWHVPLDQQLGGNLETSAASEFLTLSQDETTWLLSHAKKHYGCNVYYLLLAPLYRLMAQWSKSERVVISHRSHGRNLGGNNLFFNSVGDFATNFPVGLAVDSQAEWQNAIAAIKDKFSQVPMNGVTYDWLGEQLPGYLYPDRHLTPVRANYLGNRNIPPAEVLEFIPGECDRRLASPEQKRTALLEFFFCITGDRLELQIEYSRNFHHAETIQQLGRDYLQLLRDLLANVPDRKFPSPPSLNSPVAIAKNPSLATAKQVAVITGAEQGINRAIALKLASQGKTVVAIASNTAQVQATIDQIQQSGGQGMAITADISNLEQVQTAFERVMQEAGQIDMLINSAGMTKLTTIANPNPVEWQQILAVNLFGTYYCCHVAIPYLLQQGKGKIINLGADYSGISDSLKSAYTTAMHGLEGLTKSLSKELQQQNIQVNTVCLVDPNPIPPALLEHSPTLEQIAEVVSFLLSSGADGITGEWIKVLSKEILVKDAPDVLESFSVR